MRDVRNKKPAILNLFYYRQFRFPATLIIKSVIVLTAINFFLFAFVYAPVYKFPSLIFAAQNIQADEERKQLENQLTELEKQITDYENTISQYQKQGQTLKNEIKTLESRIAKLNLQIKSVNLGLEKLNQEINETQSKIALSEKNIGFNKEALSQVLQDLYENEDKSLMEVFLANSNLSDFFGDLNDLMFIQDNLRATLNKIVQLKNEFVDQKEQLVIEKADAEALKNHQASQKQNIQKTQTQKNEILKITKGKESEYQKLVAETKKTAAEIRTQIFQLLGGGELNFEKAYELAKFAEQATGVRAALILAVLDRESALGSNVGQCVYKTAMHPTRDIPAFLNIIKDLGLEKNLETGAIKVSCPNADGAYGGAMGPAQFIPSTWVLFKERVAKVTGNNPPNPWNNTDAFIATALYLKDAGAANNEKIAAAKYYCGSRWNRYVCTNVYGKKVIEQAKLFQDDIDILNAS
ncbi:MAG: lytic murein transglycosylase [Patescibacteria group bacterium]